MAWVLKRRRTIAAQLDTMGLPNAGGEGMT
jgi:hypothetical protein